MAKTSTAAAFPRVVIVDKTIPISAARPGQKRTGFKGVTIHETANYRRSADARSHAQYMAGQGRNTQVSSHYYTDDEVSVRTIPENEIAWHSGDGRRVNGGNLTTIAIEICENWGYLPPEYAGAQKDVKGVEKATEQEKADAMARFAKCVDNASQLAAEILHRHGIKKAAGYLHRHYDWSGKDCPHNIRKDLPVGWNTFCAKAQLRLDALWGAASEPPVQTEAEQKPTDTLYRVQAGAFTSEQNAKKLLADLKAKGFEGIVKEEKKG